jgi:uncharacterized OsmC-like protein
MSSDDARRATHPTNPVDDRQGSRSATHRALEDQTMTATTLIHGVDTGALGSFVEHTQSKPDYAGTAFSANVVWQGGFRNEIQVRDLDPQYADEPAVLGGTDTASNPVEQILGAFGACLAIGYTAGAIGRGIHLRALELDLTGIIDLPVFFGLKDGHAGFSEIDVVVRIDSDASPEALAALHEAVLRTSPVGNTLERPVAVHARLEEFSTAVAA